MLEKLNSDRKPADVLLNINRWNFHSIISLWQVFGDRGAIAYSLAAGTLLMRCKRGGMVEQFSREFSNPMMNDGIVDQMISRCYLNFWITNIPKGRFLPNYWRRRWGKVVSYLKQKCTHFTNSILHFQAFRPRSFKGLIHQVFLRNGYYFSLES